MPQIEIDMHELQKRPGCLIGIGAGSVVFVLALVALFSSLFTPRAVAEVPTPTLTATPAPTATPLPTPTPPPPIPTPEPDIRVWMPDALGAYLLDNPGGAISIQVPNGEHVRLLDEVQPYGGVNWLAVSYLGRDGWIVEQAVYTLPAPPAAVVTSQDGAFLRTAPFGQVITWLSPGSPIIQILEEVDDETYTWAHVVVPDGRDGWVARFLLGDE